MKLDIQHPIIVTGCSRSGSSMVAQIIHMCGAFSGVTGPANTGNGKGMLENDRIYSQVVEPYLTQIGADTFGQYPLPDVKQMPIPSDWGERVHTAIREDGYTKGPWMYKSSKACLLWPIWDYSFQNAKWIIVRRRSADIIYSCMHTAFMAAFRNPANQQAVSVQNEQEGWKWWVHRHEDRFIEMMQDGLNCKVVWPERMVRGDYQQIYETIEWLGLKWKSEVLNFIDPKLWKARRNA